jgi:restriction system protein
LISGDGGIDLNAYVEEASDFFAGTHVQVQVKRWRHAIGSVDINNFRGALSATAKGIFVTTSRYTRAALLEARHQFKPCITLIDGGRLSGMVNRLGLPFEDVKS